MSNHIGKAIRANPIPAIVLILNVIIFVMLCHMASQPEPICVVEATPVQQ